MSNHESVTASGEPAVGDQRDLVAESAAHDGAGGAKHLAHAGTATRALVANDHHVARLDLACENRGRRALFTIKNSRGAAETQTFLAGDLRHRAFGREVAMHDDEMAVFLDRIAEWTHDV